MSGESVDSQLLAENQQVSGNSPLHRERRETEWEALGAAEAPSWYLDSRVALQKRAVHRDLVMRWTRGAQFQRVLKTDLFEEANGDDQIYLDLPVEANIRVGIDFALSVVRKCASQPAAGDLQLLAGDGRSLPFRDEAFDLILSTSTLDHFRSEEEFLVAVREVVRVLAPNGRLILTLDNPRNPLYRGLQFASRWGLVPFLLGYTPNERRMRRTLEGCGMSVLGQEWLIHNPRGISTLLFLGLRRALGKRADAAVDGLLRVFRALSRLPSRRYSACFHATVAVKHR